jgi:hypothetical protein
MAIPYYSVKSDHYVDPITNTSNSDAYKPIKQYIPPHKRKPEIPKPPIQLGGIDLSEKDKDSIHLNVEKKDTMREASSIS